MYKCVYICMYMYICICMYVYTYICVYMEIILFCNKRGFVQHTWMFYQ